MRKMFFLIIFYLITTFSINAQHFPISFRVFAGIAHLPMSKWKSEYGNTSYITDKYTTQNPTIYEGISIYYHINNTHSIYLSSELIKPNIRFTGAEPYMNQTTDTVFLSPFRIDWKFQGIPLTLGYEYQTKLWKDKLIPFFGFGASIYISSLKYRDVIMINSNYNVLRGGGTRQGSGYGIHGSLGFISNICNHISAIWQVRYRYSDGMAFTDKKSDVKVEFSGADFNIGIEYGF